jgi:hypothetical protein
MFSSPKNKNCHSHQKDKFFKMVWIKDDWDLRTVFGKKFLEQKKNVFWVETKTAKCSKERYPPFYYVILWRI